MGDFTVTATTDVFLPILVFCIAFGLSMDYEIILLTRILEEHHRTGDTTQAVTYGLDRTATQFTWASLIVAVIMTALATSGLTFLKLVGVGLALAALLDATVVRGLLVPAVMALAGRANWWTPRWTPRWARPLTHLPDPRSPGRGARPEVIGKDHVSAAPASASTVARPSPVPNRRAR
ncbi:MMPL family transporter [Streptomyces sp. NL15-2K]|uniref:MMPL family transporter n=1 Tax=Streptomyces sp. NL15-2K TaxID=376149 RepID=UPI000FFAFF98|nr:MULTISPECIES: MMPL family transporter [Actinomycetes]WKX11565.1 MMPL family transporter [Kutzneria buriramensis]GCB47023.1 hypothetical protein SNL152K_4325 [Streptomyces sp. NL15-2K]